MCKQLDLSTCLALLVMRSDAEHNGEFTIVANKDGFRCFFGWPELGKRELKQVLSVYKWSNLREAITDAITRDIHIEDYRRPEDGDEDVYEIIEREVTNGQEK